MSSEIGAVWPDLSACCVAKFDADIADLTVMHRGTSAEYVLITLANGEKWRLENDGDLFFTRPD